MSKTITYYKKHPHGKVVYSVIDDTKEPLQKLTRHSNLTASDLDALRSLGFQTKEITKP